MSTHRARIARIERLRNTPNGNPRFRFHFLGGSSAKSEPDAGWTYEVTSHWEGRVVDVRPVGQWVRVSLVAPVTLASPTHLAPGGALNPNVRTTVEHTGSTQFDPVGGHGYDWRPICSCGWSWAQRFAADHAAQQKADEHAAGGLLHFPDGANRWPDSGRTMTTVEVTS